MHIQQFDLDQLPFSHACATCKHRELSCYPMCSHYYTTNSLVIAYAGAICPVGDQTDWIVTNDVRERIVLPPITQRRYGRCKEKRISSRGDEKSTRKCSKCMAIINKLVGIQFNFILLCRTLLNWSFIILSFGPRNWGVMNKYFFSIILLFILVVCTIL